MKSLIDVSLIQKKMKQTEIAKGRVIVELEAERKSREKTEGKQTLEGFEFFSPSLTMLAQKQLKKLVV